MTLGCAKGEKDGQSIRVASTARFLRLATASEIVFLIVSGFFLDGCRAHRRMPDLKPTGGLELLRKPDETMTQRAKNQ